MWSIQKDGDHKQGYIYNILKKCRKGMDRQKHTKSEKWKIERRGKKGERERSRKWGGGGMGWEGIDYESKGEMGVQRKRQTTRGVAKTRGEDRHKKKERKKKQWSTTSANGASCVNGITSQNVRWTVCGTNKHDVWSTIIIRVYNRVYL